MSDMLKKYLGTLVRSLLAGIIPFLVANGMSAADSDTFVNLLAGLLIAVVWGIWEKNRSRKETLAGLALPEGSTLADAKAAVKTGAAPAVTTEVHEIPILKSGG